MALHPFSRAEKIASLESNNFDLLVVGGGITGVGIALDAESRGLRTALVEMHDFASGTSSRSTKLVHGGLRYLKQLKFGLVREVGLERAVVHRNAPHLVHPEKMLLPLIRGGNFGKLMTSIGLAVYDGLAGVKKEERRKMLTRDQTCSLEPLLRKDLLEGGGLYSEYRTDDARLVMGVAQTAQNMGAVLLNYVRVTAFLRSEGKLCGVEVMDDLEDRIFSVRAKHVVNAGGPWVDELRSLDQINRGKKLSWSKGVHVVVSKSKFPLKQTVYFDLEDGRMMFAIPRDEVVYLGTTDSSYEGVLNDLEVTKEEVEYLLHGVNNMFQDVALQVSDVLSSWAGIRPLIKEEGKSTKEMSRRDEIFESDSGLISIAGGKLTGYRKMAKRVVDLVVKRGKFDVGKCRTDHLVLDGGEYRDYQEVKYHIENLGKKLAELQLDSKDAEYLVHNYGKNSNAIVEQITGEDLDQEWALLRAELSYTVDHEMVQRGVDFFERRSGRLNFRTSTVSLFKERALTFMMKKLGWNEERLEEERRLLELAIRRVGHFTYKDLSTP